MRTFCIIISSGMVEMEKRELFLRPATGLIREWSVFDAWVYAFLSLNLVTLGFYIWTFNSFIPAGNPILATIIAMGFLTIQNIVYATLISSIPRVGGDYVWQSRLIGGFWGFFLSWPGWVFCLWLWIPIYGEMFSWLIAAPLSALAGNISLAMWWGSDTGLFLSSMLVIVFVFFYVGVGMKWYARIQKWMFYVAIIGMIIFVGALLTTSPSAFETTFDSYMAEWAPDVGYTMTYQGTIDLATVDWGYDFASLSSINWTESFKLIPMLLFWIMWTVWGATLFGEVRGAGDWGRMFKVIQYALIAAGVAAILLWLLFSNVIGYDFYQSVNVAYTPWYPDLGEQFVSSPTMLAAMVMGGGFLASLMVILMAAWFFAWSGTVFLSSTRVIFASAFDRAFPKAFAGVKFRFNTPISALLLMALPSIPLTYIYFYVPGYDKMTLWSTFAIAIAYFGSTLACVLFPLRRPKLFGRSPASKYKVGRVPLVSILGTIYLGFLLAVFWLWAVDPDMVYGINAPESLPFGIGMYILAVVIFYSFKYYRKKEGIELDRVFEEIPVE